jgi:DNA-directed RNA polymerase
MHSQAELERRMILAGRNRLEAAVSEAESKGKAHRNPYAHAIHRNYTAPLAEMLADLYAKPTPLRGGNALALLRNLDCTSVAFLAVRACLNCVLSGKASNHRALAYSIGRSIHYELVLSQIAEALPDLHYTLARDFQRRMSEDEEHRMAVYKTKAAEAGASWVEWDKGSRDVVGVFLLGRLETIGLVAVSQPFAAGRGRQAYREVGLTEAVRGILDASFEFLAETRPDYGPCVEPPLPWPGMVGGGYHTPEMRRAHRYLAKVAASARPLLRDRQMPLVLAAVNHLQATPWRVNTRVLETVLALSKTAAGVPGAYTPPGPQKPDRPVLTGPGGVAQGEAEEAALSAWKGACRAFYESHRLGTVEHGRFYRATRQALQLKDYPNLYFVHFLDSRGRDYVLSSGLSPQGSDLQKALLEFAEAKPLGPDGEQWLMLQGANTWGNDVDKQPLAERLRWARHALGVASMVDRDPVGSVSVWRDAEEPLQFLAWCFEAAAYMRDGSTYQSRLRVALDGSCNGLQHFAAMLRDEVGGRKVNLIPGPKPEDVYKGVAEVTQALLPELPDSADKDWWLDKGVARGAMKRATMTLPYGVTKDSAVRYVAADYLTAEMPDTSIGERLQRARALMDAGWPALEKALPAAMQVRGWLSRLGREASQRRNVLSWPTPSGFLATQAYYKPEIIRVRTWLHGSAHIRVAVESSASDTHQHGTALAPNFVHSLDAAHLHMVTVACQQEGINSLGLVHDSFSTHAADAGRLGEIIREQFVKLYSENDVLTQLQEALQGQEAPPPAGNLDITGVKASTYAFL